MTRTYHEGDEPVPGAGYRLERFLGRGGFGEVWRATTPGGAEAAVKIIRLGGAEGRKEFRALQLVKRIRHPNLMPLVAFWLKSADGTVLDDALAGQPELDIRETAGGMARETLVAPSISRLSEPAELVIAMGLGDKSLFDRLEECRAEGLPGIPQEELLGYLEDAAEAIDFLNSPVHDQGAGPVAIQHCDVKPHNLMIVGGAVQVCDFGLARMIGADRVTSAAASVAYAAPELLETGKPSPSTDQYSLAITYYELRAGKLPYCEETLVAVVEAKHRGDLDFSACTPAEQEVLRRATLPDPARRYASSMEMARALRAAMAGGPGRGPGGRKAAPEQRAGAPGRAVRGLILVSVLGAAGFAAWWHWGRTPVVIPPGPEPPEVVGNTPSLPTPVPPTPSPQKFPDQPTPPQPSPPKPSPPQPSSVAAAEAFKASLDRGTELLNKGDYDGAIAAFGEAAKLNPKDVRPLSRRGTAWFRKTEFQKAVDDFTAALKISPDPGDYVNRGRSYWGLDRVSEAIADFDAAIQSAPQQAAAYYFRGDCRLKLEQYKQAVTDLSQAIALSSQGPDPTFALSDAYTLRGSGYLLLERPADAIHDFTAALGLDPADPSLIHQLRASAYLLDGRENLGKRDERIAELLKQLDQKPTDAAPYRQLAYLLAASPEAEFREAKKAVELATRACELTSWKSADELDALAAAYAEAGQFDKAVEWGKQAVEKAPDPKAAERYRAHLAGYEKKTPLREPAP